MYQSVRDAPNRASIVRPSYLAAKIGDLNLQVREETQAAAVADEVAALVSVTRPIINGVLTSIGDEYLGPWDHDRTRIPLKHLGRLRKEGDGDTGIAFEYAIHDAVRTQNPIVMERVSEALKICKIKEGDPSSILFAIEKQGSKQLIETDLGLITDESRVLSGSRGHPVKLKGQMNKLAAAFRRGNTRPNLPQSIRGLWKADLFLGSQTPDHWVGTSVKINPSHLEAAAGLRIAIVPTRSGKSDNVKKHDQKNLIVCPIPHDGSFMQVFYEGWRIVQVLCETDFKTPKEVELPVPHHREVARVYTERRDHPILEVIEAVGVFAQPNLLVTETETANAEGFQTSLLPDTNTIISPRPLQLKV